MATNVMFCLLPLALLAVSCGRAPSVPQLPAENSAYYWRTTWHLDSTETAFLRRHSVHRLFCRYFDVVLDSDSSQPMPNATIRFPLDSAALAGIELVPTVYITADCMSRAPAGGWPSLARRLVARVVQMNATHSLPAARELQVDCDYTLRSRSAYYDFLSQVREEAARHGMALSATIRLHQLSMPAPPVDYGVLMVYNTGDPQRFAERNPILDRRDVQPYLHFLPSYPLPLAAAYPVYAWQRTIGGVRIEHTVEAREILRVKQMVERARPDMGRAILVYSLDKYNINRYNDDTYQQIFRHPQP